MAVERIDQRNGSKRINDETSANNRKAKAKWHMKISMAKRRKIIKQEIMKAINNNAAAK